MKSFVFALAFIASFTVSANTETVTGIIKEVECNRPTGLGIVNVETKVGRVLVTQWYRVDSQELCSNTVTTTTGVNSTRLSEIAFYNYVSRDFTISELTLVDGMVKDVKNVGKVDQVRYSQNISGYEHNGQQEAFDWYFSARRNR